MKHKLIPYGIAVIMLLMLTACKHANATMAANIVFQDLNIATPEVTLHARVTGNLQSGKALIAIHGGPGNSSDYMVSLGQLAGDNLAVVIYDQRGTGQSSDPGDDPANYTLAKYVDDLEAVRAAIRIDRVTLMGHSWGGVVAQRYATIYPQHVHALILMGSGAPSMQASLAAQEGKLGRIASLQEQGIIPAQITGLQDILPAYFSDPHFEMPAEMNPLFYNPMVERLTWKALGDFDFSAETQKLTLPTLVLYGQDDPFGMTMVNALVSALSSAKVKLAPLDQCGHYWQECPDQFFSNVRNYIQESNSANQY